MHRCTRQGPTRPKSSVLFLSTNGTFHGFDYCGRSVAVTPAAAFAFQDPMGAWELSAVWPQQTRNWIETARGPLTAQPRQAQGCRVSL